jgi:hypothetical protein
MVRLAGTAGRASRGTHAQLLKHHLAAVKSFSQAAGGFTFDGVNAKQGFKRAGGVPGL